MAIIKLSVIEQRRLSAFITCLVLATMAWLFIALSAPNNYVVKQVIVFKNAPQRRAFRSLQSDTVDATVKGSGWQMLFSSMRKVDRPITIDLRTLENKDFVELGSQLKQINIKREAEKEIISINPDTLYFDFTNRTEKRVPVKLSLSAAYRSQFMQSGNIIIKPAYITVSGPSSRINKIKEWPTDTLALTNLQESVNTHVNLRPVNEGNMVIFPKTVQVNVPVDEYTEKTLWIPVKVINKSYDNVKVFPQKVRVTFTVAINKYADINEDFFEASADLGLWREHAYSELPVSLERIPPFCKIVTVVPRNVDFIVKK